MHESNPCNMKIRDRKYLCTFLDNPNKTIASCKKAIMLNPLVYYVIQWEKDEISKSERTILEKDIQKKIRLPKELCKIIFEYSGESWPNVKTEIANFAFDNGYVIAYERFMFYVGDGYYNTHQRFILFNQVKRFSDTYDNIPMCVPKSAEICKLRDDELKFRKMNNITKHIKSIENKHCYYTNNNKLAKNRRRKCYRH